MSGGDLIETRHVSIAFMLTVLSLV